MTSSGISSHWQRPDGHHSRSCSRTCCSGMGWLAFASKMRKIASSTGISGVMYPLLRDRKSTRLNSSHGYISYAVFCLKKKKHVPNITRQQVHDLYVMQSQSIL